MQIPRRQFLQTASAAAAAAVTAASQAAPARPNIVLFVADDLGFKDVGYQGSEIRTPNIDRLANQGVRFNQMYACPLCSPTRAAILTGRQPVRFGLGYTVVRPWSTYGLPPTETTIADMLRAAGYRTAAIGKWHLGHTNVRHLPNSRGFDHFYGHLNGAIDYFKHERDGGVDWQRNGKTVQESGYTTELLAAEAKQWIGSQDRQRPYFLYMPFNAPHTPLQALDAYLDKYKSITDSRRRTYAAMVECLDTAVGEVAKAALDRGPTLIIFVSDNGGPRGAGADNGPLRAGKSTVFEGGIRVPAFFHYSNTLKPAEFGDLSSVTDLLPTLAEVTDTKYAGNPLDGVSLWSALQGNGKVTRDELFFCVQPDRGPRQQAFRKGPWKLVRISGPQPKEMLFHLVDDPNEKQDRIGSEIAIAESLRAKLNTWAATEPPGEASYSLERHPGWITPKDWSRVAVE